MAPSATQSPDATLLCPGCRCHLKVDRQVPQVEEKCPVCGSEVRLTLFPQLFRSLPGDDGHTAAAEGEATCSFFPELRAETECGECGCFMSGRATLLCEGRTLCLPCLHRLREVEKVPSCVARAYLHDKIALALVTLLAPLSLFTSPLALYLLLRHRKNAQGFVPRGRVVWWTAFSLSVAWLIAWVVFIVIWVSLIVDDFS